MRTFRRLAVAVAAVAAAGAIGAAPLRAEIYNCFCPLPSYDVNIFNITIAGNVINNLNLNVVATDPLINPFVKIGGTSTVTAALDGNGNTVVTFTGTIGISSSDSFDYGPHSNHLPHIGLDGSHGAGTPGGGPELKIISQGFSNSGTNPFAVPGGLAFYTPPPGAGVTDIDYLVFFAKVTDPGKTIGQWFEAPINGTDPDAASVTLTNYTANSETLSDAGYYISESYIPLDQLNYNSNPPPDISGSPFIPLPSLDGTILPGGNGTGGAGGTITAASLPEPSTVISMATGLAIVGAAAVRRGRVAGRVRRAARTG